MGIKKKLALSVMGTVFLMTSFSGIFAQADELFVDGQRHTQECDDPFNAACNLNWSDFEHCYEGMYYDSSCSPDFYDDEDYGPNDVGPDEVLDEVVTTAQIQQRFNLVSFLLAQLASHFPEIWGPGSGDNSCAGKSGGSCSPPAITLDLRTLPCSSDFLDSYLDYATHDSAGNLLTGYTGPQAWVL